MADVNFWTCAIVTVGLGISGDYDTFFYMFGVTGIVSTIIMTSRKG